MIGVLSDTVRDNYGLPGAWRSAVARRALIAVTSCVAASEVISASGSARAASARDLARGWTSKSTKSESRRHFLTLHSASKNLLSKTQAFLTIGSSIVSFGEREKPDTSRLDLGKHGERVEDTSRH